MARVGTGNLMPGMCFDPRSSLSSPELERSSSELKKGRGEPPTLDAEREEGGPDLKEPLRWNGLARVGVVWSLAWRLLRWLKGWTESALLTERADVHKCQNGKRRCRCR